MASISLCISQSGVGRNSTGFTFSCKYWNRMKNTGTKNRMARMPNNMPPTTPEPNDELPLAPAPVAYIYLQEFSAIRPKSYWQVSEKLYHLAVFLPRSGTFAC